MLDKIPKEGFEPTRDMCRSFLQFEEHGVILSHEAKLLEDAGFLKSKIYILPPMSKSILLYEITNSGRKESGSFQELWTKFFAPLFTLENDKILDEYLQADADEHYWSFSKKRLEEERQAGRFNQAIKRAT